MLILTSVSGEFTATGQKYNLLLTSPRIPGSHFKVETDAVTAQRLRMALTHEMRAVCAIDRDSDGGDQPHDHSFDR